MILEKKFFGLRSARLLYVSENIEDILVRKYDYLTIISFSDLGLEKYGFELVKKKVANIYLNEDLEKVFNWFSTSTRNEIHRSYKIPELEVRIGDQNFKDTYRVYYDFEKSQKRKPWKHSSFREVINANIYYKGELIAGVPVYENYPYLQVRAIFSKRLVTPNKELLKMISFGTRRLIWELVKFGKARGYELLGLGAVTTITPQKANVAQFKMFFGGKVEEEYTYIRESPRFKLIKKFIPRR